MKMATAGKETGDGWLHGFIDAAVEEGLCTKTNCTTCGAREFRIGLLSLLELETGRDNRGRIGREEASALAQELASVRPSKERESGFESATRCLLYEIWLNLRNPGIDGIVEPAILGTWSGRVLERMQAHHRERIEAQRRRREEVNPTNVLRRRSEKKRLRQEAHLQRIREKRERDRIWWETRNKETEPSVTSSEVSHQADQEDRRELR